LSPAEFRGAASEDGLTLVDACRGRLVRAPLRFESPNRHVLRVDESPKGAFWCELLECDLVRHVE
jgi:hypothetical protein